jgi:3-mercaptopyruvate sulfurtransferase SseA
MASGAFAFQAKHIPGSLHFDTSDQCSPRWPWTTTSSSTARTSPAHASVSLYSALRARGYRRVRRYGGGLLDWEDAGLPLEGDWASGS